MITKIGVRGLTVSCVDASTVPLAVGTATIDEAETVLGMATEETAWEETAGIVKAGGEYKGVVEYVVGGGVATGAAVVAAEETGAGAIIVLGVVVGTGVLVVTGMTGGAT